MGILSVSPMLQGNLQHHLSSELDGPVEAKVIGVIRTVDINFSWFHPNKLYTCTGVRLVLGEDEMYYLKYFHSLNLWLATNKRALVRRCHKACYYLM